MVSAPKSRVAWAETHRLILSQYPPIDLFDDLVDPRDWEALARAESRTNPRIYEEIGDLSLVPTDRRVSGPGASWVMAAFTHISPDRTSRFSDGSYGVYYAGKELETAIREHTFHMARAYADASMSTGWISEVRQLVGTIDQELTDIRGAGFESLLDKDPQIYGVPQQFARAEIANRSKGIVYPSQRHEGGECIAAFYPDVVSIPSQGDHFRYHWNGTRIDYVQQKTGEQQVYAM
jgi:hypothetical protein